MAEEDEQNLNGGQQWVIRQLRKLGAPITADEYAAVNWGLTVEELGAEEQAEIPEFLMEAYRREQGELREQEEKEKGGE